LYLHELFIRLGYDITCASLLSNGRDIDFLLRRGESAFYLEATIARRSHAECAADARRNRIYREMDRLETDFMLSIIIDAPGPSDMKNVGKLRQRLQDWLGTLDLDEAEQQWNTLGEGPTFPWADETGWSLVFRTFPSRPEYRGQPASRPLGMIMDETGGLIDDERPLRRALNDKAPRRYGDLTLPYVVAIAEEPFSSDDEEWHRTNLLYGHDAIAYGDGQPPRRVRESDGIWRGPAAAPRHRRIASVLLTSDLTPWTIDPAELELWDNPFANQPVPSDAIPEVVRRRQLLLDNGAGEITRVEAPCTPGSILEART
jgi:hypothetical protein